MVGGRKVARLGARTCIYFILLWPAVRLNRNHDHPSGLACPCHVLPRPPYLTRGSGFRGSGPV